MKKMLLICMLSFGLVLVWNMVIAEDGFYVISVRKNNYAPVPKTGQTTSYATGDDGYWEKGIASPNPRFTDNGDGTVTDNLTELIWLKNARCGALQYVFNDALTWANSLYDGWTGDGSGGDCGLSDGSSPGDWRLPNLKELQSLIDYGINNPCIPNTAGTGKWTSGDPFINLWIGYYWSSTTYSGNTDVAWSVNFDNGSVYNFFKSPGGHSVWPVRGGN